MTQSARPGGTSSAHIPQLLVSIAAALVAFTGLWLWFVGQGTDGQASIRQDSYNLDLLIMRIHWGAAIALAAIVLFMAARALVSKQTMRLVLLFAFLIFVGIGFWAGYAADWPAARLWSETVGTKLSAGISLGENRPSLPSSLRQARVHLSVVPAALLIVAVASLLHDRR